MDIEKIYTKMRQTASSHIDLVARLLPWIKVPECSLVDQRARSVVKQLEDSKILDRQISKSLKFLSDFISVADGVSAARRFVYNRERPTPPRSGYVF